MVFTLLHSGAMCVLGKSDANVNTVLIGRTLVVEPDPLAIKLVALDGHQMELTKEERLEAIKIMASNKVPREHIAWRLRMKLDTLERLALRAKIALPKMVTPAHWSVEYIDKRLTGRKEKSKENAIRRGREYRERKRREASDNLA